MARLLFLLAALTALLTVPAAAFRDSGHVRSHDGSLVTLSSQQQRERVSSRRVAFGPAGLPHPTFAATPHLVQVNQPPHAPSRHVFASKLAEGGVLTLPDAERIALDFIAKQAKVPRAHLAVLSSLKSEHNGVTHVYIRQVVHGLEVANADANVNLDRFGRVLSFGSSLQSGPSPGPSKQRGASVASMLFSSQQQHHFSTGSTTPTPSVSPHQALTSLLTKLERLDPQSHGSLDSTLLASFSSHDSLASSDAAQQRPRGYIGSYAALAGISLSDIPVSLAYLHTPSVPTDATSLSAAIERPPLSLVYAYEIESPASWIHAHVCAQTGQVLSVIDWVADSHDGHEAPHTRPAGRRRHRRRRQRTGDKDKGIPVGSTYRVFPIGVNDPDDGPRVLLKHVAWPASPDSSAPATPASTIWVSRGSTSGNNVVAEDNPYGADSTTVEPSGHYRPHPGKHHKTFDYPVDFTKNPSTYLDAAITQLFYTNNALHDIFYAYGFTEPAGNFQKHNRGRGGVGGDAVVAYAQDGSGYNNANFATPPDGKSGKMRMYVWNTVTPYRDGDLENGIIIHEFGHGVSTRLTGGRLNSGCLGWGEAGGMGEGWGDVWSVMLRMRNASMAHRSWPHVWEMGKYANGGQVGIRKYPYSPSLEVNPSTYSTLNANGYWGVHAKGEVWAVMLLEVLWSLVDELGFTPDWLSASQAHGNTLMMQIVVDALKMQPCRPTFLDARDAMFQAEQVLTGGKFKCVMWKAFAKRGLGVDARRLPAKSPWMDETRVDGFSVPGECVDMGKVRAQGRGWYWST